MTITDFDRVREFLEPHMLELYPTHINQKLWFRVYTDENNMTEGSIEVIGDSEVRLMSKKGRYRATVFEGAHWAIAALMLRMPQDL